MVQVSCMWWVERQSLNLNTTFPADVVDMCVFGGTDSYSWWSLLKQLFFACHNQIVSYYLRCLLSPMRHKKNLSASDSHFGVGCSFSQLGGLILWSPCCGFLNVPFACDSVSCFALNTVIHLTAFSWGRHFQGECQEPADTACGAAWV